MYAYLTTAARGCAWVPGPAAAGGGINVCGLCYHCVWSVLPPELMLMSMGGADAGIILVSVAHAPEVTLM